MSPGDLPARLGGCLVAVDGVGSGFLIAPGTVLTCRHVIAGRADHTVEHAGSSRPATVRWHSDGPADDPECLPDLALLDVPGMGDHPWAELDASPPRPGDELLLLGLSRRFSGSSYLPDPQPCRAGDVITPDGHQIVQIGHSLLVPGMSGGPVLNLRTGRVCAVAIRTGDTRIPVGGWATVLAPHLVGTPPIRDTHRPDPRWRAARRGALAPDLPVLLRHPHHHAPADLVPSALLRPERAAVAFHGRTAELDLLATWCAGPEGFSVRLVTGQGGAGKTRLALELMDRQAAQGWITGFLGGTADAGTVTRLGERLAAIGEPALVVVDYAEGSPVLVTLIEALASAGPPCRLLLLARHDGDWWTELPHRLDYGSRGLVTGAVHLPLAPMASTADDQRVEFQLAVRAFATLYGVDPPRDTDLVVEEVRPPVLQVHAAALLAVLRATVDRQDAPPAPIGIAGDQATFAELLDHEGRYWWASADRAGLTSFLDTTRRRQAVALATLVGAGGPRGGTRLLTTTLALPAAQAEQAARWLHGLYPGEADDAQWWGPVRPDLLGEHLVAAVFAERPELAEAAVADASKRRLAHALTVLTRAARHSPAMHALLVTLLLNRPEKRLPVAFRVAPRVGPPLGAVLADALTRLGHDRVHRAERGPRGRGNQGLGHDRVHRAEQGPRGRGYRGLGTLGPALLGKLGQRLPAASGELAPAAVIVLDAMLAFLGEGGEHDDSDVAELRMARTEYLRMLGRTEEALAEAQTAVALLERAHAELPGGAALLLTAALCGLGTLLADVGRHTEAADAVERARGLSAGRPDSTAGAFMEAVMLNTIAVTNARAGNAGASDAGLERAIRTLRSLPEPDRFDRALLGEVLTMRAQSLVSTARLEEAGSLAEEACDVLRVLVEEDADQFLPWLGQALLVRMFHSRLSHGPQRARSAATEAVEVLRRASRTHHRSLSLFATALAGAADVAWRTGDPTAAAELAGEAMAIIERLEQESPHLLRPERAVVSTIYLETLGYAGEQAIEVAREAVERVRAMGDHPVTPGLLAMTLQGYGQALARSGRPAEAAQVGLEAVGHLRVVMARTPGEGLLVLADVLDDTAEWLAASGMENEAVPLAAEAVTVQRGLCQAQASLTLHNDLCLMLRNYAVHLLNTHRFDEAADAAGEATRGLARLLADDPGYHAFHADTRSLYARALLLAGRAQEAVTVGMEVVAQARDYLATDREGSRNAVLTALTTQGAALHQTGRHKPARDLLIEALALAEESRAAGDPRPAVAAWATSALAEVLAALGQPEQGREVARAGLRLQRELAADDPEGRRAALVEALVTLAADYARAGDGETARDLATEALTCSGPLGPAGGPIDHPVARIAALLVHLGQSMVAGGWPEEAVAVYEESIRLHWQVAALLEFQAVLGCLGRTTRAVEITAGAVRLARAEAVGALPYALIHQATALAEAGRAADAIPLAEEALDGLLAFGDTEPGTLAQVHTELVLLHLAAGARGQAVRQADAARRAFAEVADGPRWPAGDLASFAQALHAFAVGLLDDGRAVEALAPSRQSESLYRLLFGPGPRLAEAGRTRIAALRQAGYHRRAQELAAAAGWPAGDRMAG